MLVTAGLGVGPARIWGPCQVVWSEESPTLAGFGYGTLPGHPERGEEAFVVGRDDDGAVWFEVRAFSRPDRWFTRAGGPAVRAVQHAYAWWLGRTLRRLCAESLSAGHCRSGEAQNRANERIGARGPYFGARMPAASSSRQTRPR